MQIIVENAMERPRPTRATVTKNIFAESRAKDEWMQTDKRTDSHTQIHK